MYFNKYIDFIMRKFYSNARYTSSFFYTLKFFFEKNTKTLNVVAKLGNVYRSSKWVDLRMQNIKAPVLPRFLALFGFIMLIIVLSYMEVPFISTFLASVAKSVLFVIDMLYYSWVMLVSFFYTCVAYVRRNICVYITLSKPYSSEAPVVYNTQTVNGNFHTSGVPFTSYTSKIYRHGNKFVPTVLWNFYKSSESLALMAQSHFTFDKVFNPTSPLLKISSQQSLTQFTSLNLHQDTNRFNQKIASDTALNTMPYIKNYESEFYGVDLPLSVNLIRSVYSYSPSSNSFSRIGVNTERTLMFNHSINATLARENRWLWKSNVFSNTSSSSLNAVSKLKKFINNPVFSSSLLNKNLWLSSKASENIDIQSLNLLDTAQQSSRELKTISGGRGDYHNINFMEDSMLWSLNRFLSYQNMQNMQHTIPTSFSRINSQASTAPNVSSAFSQSLSQLALSYNFTTNGLYSPFAILSTQIVKQAPSFAYMSTGSNSSVIDHGTMNLLGVFFSSTASKSRTLLYFANV